MMKRVYNFGAGPAVLPVSVLEEAARGVLEIAGSGMSILEVSHRGGEYEAIHADARARVLSVLGLDSGAYTVLFLGGGASLQFAMLPMNFLPAAGVADYVHTGEWSHRAIAEAGHFGSAHVAASSEDRAFSYIPRSLDLTPGAAYLHITTNNTIEGTEWTFLPESGGAPLVADMSSDIFSRVIGHSEFDMIYAGAQKNAGPAGVTVVIVRNAFLDRARSDVPAILSYKTHAKSDSLYNTPPVFAVYVLDLVLRWIEAEGGVAALEARNRAKAALVYGALDSHPGAYEPTVTDVGDRSSMNVTFRLRNAERDQEFLAGAAQRSLIGLKGHRSVGGFRASLYNAFPMDGCNALAEYLDAFAG